MQASGEQGYRGGQHVCSPHAGSMRRVNMEKWRRVWREGVVPQLSTLGLHALYSALQMDDPRLLQRVTCNPAFLETPTNYPVNASCAIGFCGWKGDGVNSVGDLQEFFTQVCQDADEALGEPGCIRYFLNWYDDTPRQEMRRELFEEVKIALHLE